MSQIRESKIRTPCFTWWVLCRMNIAHAFFNYRLLELEGGEYSQTTSVSTSLLWKFLWHPQAAQMRASLVPSSPLAMNSLQPSTAYPPMLAAWFFWHSAYRTLLIADDDVVEILVDPSLFTTTCLFFMTLFFSVFLFFSRNPSFRFLSFRWSIPCFSGESVPHSIRSRLWFGRCWL